MARAQLVSFKCANVDAPESIHPYLKKAFSEMDDTDQTHWEKILKRMKSPPTTSTIRVNLIKSTIQQLKELVELQLKEWVHETGDNEIRYNIQTHPIFSDIVTITVFDNHESLESHSIPIVKTNRAQHIIHREGWPTTHRVVLCDRMCGEAVLRGSHIYLPGILGADAGIHIGEKVAVYADLDGNASRGILLHNYQGTCVFLGMGIAKCSRNDMFRREAKGVGVVLSTSERVGPILPPLFGLQPRGMPQNLPSIVVGHALDPHANEIIIDMCSAPGGKASHIASLVRNQAIIVSCDKSRSKMRTAKEMFERMGATCITPLALDTTQCVVSGKNTDEITSVQEVLSAAEVSRKDGLKNVKHFYPGTFDRIVLDPPCSALGLRPKLKISISSIEELLSFAKYQRRFIHQAVLLLKVGGFMTYSTCTVNPDENEAMVHYILNHYPVMTLCPIEFNIGRPGLQGFGLNEEQCHSIRRFDPTDTDDTIGFFVAKFQKTSH